MARNLIGASCGSGRSAVALVHDADGVTVDDPAGRRLGPHLRPAQRASDLAARVLVDALADQRRAVTAAAALELVGAFLHPAAQQRHLELRLVMSLLFLSGHERSVRRAWAALLPDRLHRTFTLRPDHAHPGRGIL